MKKPLTVYVGGAPYAAEMEDKVLRFRRNWAVDWVASGANDARNGYDMNALAIMYRLDKLSLREYAEYHMMIGYSVSGFCDLSEFGDLEVKTPHWTREGRRPWASKKR